MKNIVVVAYYHLLHALALALTFEEKPNLYISTEYTDMDDQLIERIRHCGVFNDVVKMDTNEYLEPFLGELRKTEFCSVSEIEAINTSIFDKYIDTYYSEKFKDADFDEDVYVYTDYHLSMYFINKHFNRIILCEDGYKIFKKRIETYNVQGYFELLQPFIEKGYYPELYFRCAKISKYICSGDYEGLPEIFLDKLEVWDFAKIINEIQREFASILSYIFDFGNLEIKSDSILLIEQPLYRTGFCTHLDYYLFYNKIINDFTKKGKQVYFKPHPAGRKNLEMFDQELLTILPAQIPVECLNYLDVRFNKVVTFYSSSIDIIRNTDEKISLYNDEEITPEKISAFIKEYIKDERIKIGVFLYNFDETISKKAKVFAEDETLFDYNLYLVFDKQQRENAGKDRNIQGVEYIEVEKIDQKTLFKQAIERCDENDFSVIVSGENTPARIMSQIRMMFNNRGGECISFSAVLKKNKIPMQICTQIEEHVVLGACNVLWHKNLLKKLEKISGGGVSEIIEHIYSNKIPVDYIVGEGLVIDDDVYISEVKQIIDISKEPTIKTVFTAFLLSVNHLCSTQYDLKFDWDHENLRDLPEGVMPETLMKYVIDILTRTVVVERVNNSRKTALVVKNRAQLSKYKKSRVVNFYLSVRKKVLSVLKR